MKIYIDAGHNHSGGDTGAVGFGHKEQDINFNVAYLVGETLKRHGIDIRYSRNKITDNVGTTVAASINGRVNAANSWGANLFVSIHCNAFSDPNANGTETLVFSASGTANQLARKVNAEIVKALGTRDRGVKVRTDLGVLRNTNMPAILPELAFITNKSNCDKLVNRQGDFAKAICRGICNHLNIRFNESEGNDVENKNNTGEHWAQKHLGSLIAKKIVETPEAWRDFDNFVSKAALLALIDKATNR